MPTTQPTTRRTVKRRQIVTAAGELTLGAKLKSLRVAARLSQVAIGAQGFISTPGWVKLENNQRQPSETLLQKLVVFLAEEKVIQIGQQEALLNELCALKYSHDRRDFVRRLARNYYQSLPPV